MRPRYDFGEAVRVLRNVRNDGTYPGMAVGEPLIRRGSVGYVREFGTFLQDQLIYSVHFLEENRLVGCREEELIPADEPWVPSQFEFRDKVSTSVALPLRNDGQIEAGSEGEILKVLRDRPNGVAYHVRFPGHTLIVPERLLERIDNGA